MLVVVCSGSSPVGTPRGSGSSGRQELRCRRVGRSPGGSFWVRLVRLEELGCLPADGQLALKLTNPLACGAELGRVRCAVAGDFAAVDAVLLEPPMQTAGADAQFIGGLLDLLAR